MDAASRLDATPRLLACASEDPLLPHALRDILQGSRWSLGDPASVLLVDLAFAKSGLRASVGRHLRAGQRVLLLGERRGDAPMLDALLDDGVHGLLARADAAIQLPRALDALLAGERWLDRATMARLLEQRQRRPRPASSPLTPRERALVAAIARQPDADTSSLARTLAMAERTLRNHLSAIYAKLGLKGRVALYAWAIAHGHGGASTNEDGERHAGAPRR